MKKSIPVVKLARFTLIYVLSLCCANIYSQTQEYLEFGYKQPEKSDFEVVKPIDVSTFSGKGSFSFPLGSINTGDFSIPISLNATLGGIKVDQIASEVGHLWSLQAAGMITRSVRGHDDFHHDDNATGIANYYIGWLTQEHFNWNQIDQLLPSGNFIKRGETAETPVAYLNNYVGMNSTLAVDNNPDLYTIIFPDGRSVQFSFKDDLANLTQQIVLNDLGGIPLQIEVIPTAIKGKGQWEVVYDGCKYIFGSIGTNSEIQKYITMDTYTPPSIYGGYVNYVSSWHLKTIITPNGKEIQFDYLTTELPSVVRPSPAVQQVSTGCLDLASVPQGFTACGVRYPSPSSYSYKIQGRKKLISSITYDNPNDDSDFRVSFEYSPIQVGSGLYSLRKRLSDVLFEYYDDQNDFGSNNGAWKQLDSYQLMHHEHENGLWLESIRKTSINDPIITRFAYDGVSSGNCDFPFPLNREQDYWGYPTSTSAGMSVASNELFIPRYYLEYNMIVPHTYFLDAINSSYINRIPKDRRPNSHAGLGTLNQITFPTGGTLDIIYEPNIISNANRILQTSGPSGSDVQGPGVRVASVSRHNQNSELVSKINYVYEEIDGSSSGFTSQAISFYSGSIVPAMYSVNGDCDDVPGNSEAALDGPSGTSVTMTGMNNISTVGGHEIGYSRVELVYDNGTMGKEVRYYEKGSAFYSIGRTSHALDVLNSYSLDPLFANGSATPFSQGSVGLGNGQAPPGISFKRTFREDYGTGKLLKKEVYENDNGSFRKVMQEDYTYKTLTKTAERICQVSAWVTGGQGGFDVMGSAQVYAPSHCVQIPPSTLGSSFSYVSSYHEEFGVALLKSKKTTSFDNANNASVITEVHDDWFAENPINTELLFPDGKRTKTIFPGHVSSGKPLRKITRYEDQTLEDIDFIYDSNKNLVEVRSSDKYTIGDQPNYRTEFTVQRDAFGNPLYSTSRTSPLITHYLFFDDGLTPAAQVITPHLYGFFYDPFEDGLQNSAQAGVSPTDGYSGIGLELLTGSFYKGECDIPITTENFLRPELILSYNTSLQNQLAEIDVKIILRDINDNILEDFSVQFSDLDKAYWNTERLTPAFDVSSYQGQTLSIEFEILNLSSNALVIDNVILLGDVESAYTLYDVDDQLRVTAIQNNITNSSHFIYDDLDRLRITKDFDKNIISRYSYNNITD